MMSSSSKKAAVSDGASLPDEMIMEVLLRLPVKPLFRFRAVCRSWAALFSTEQFRTLHMATPKAAPPRLLFVSPTATSDSTTELCSISLSAEPEDDLKIFTLDSACGDSMELAMPAPCHGLNLLFDPVAPAYYICNAATRAVTRLPPFLHGIPHTSAGLGYDARTRRYKVVRLFPDIDETIRCEVYTHGEDDGGGGHGDRWRPPAGGGVPLELRAFAGHAFWDAMCRCLPPVFANGLLHWLVPSFFFKNPRVAVISFSLAEETFSFIGPPPFWNTSDPELIFSFPSDWEVEEHLVQMDNQLCMVRDPKSTRNGGHILEIWKSPDGGPGAGGAWSLYHGVHLPWHVATYLHEHELVRVIGSTTGNCGSGKKIIIATSEHVVGEMFQKKVRTYDLSSESLETILSMDEIHTSLEGMAPSFRFSLFEETLAPVHPLANPLG